MQIEIERRDPVVSGQPTSSSTQLEDVQWQKAEETRKDFNIVLIPQDKKFFISELFKVTQDAIPLILHFRTMC